MVKTVPVVHVLQAPDGEIIGVYLEYPSAVKKARDITLDENSFWCGFPDDDLEITSWKITA